MTQVSQRAALLVAPWTLVCRTSDVPTGQGVAVIVDGCQIALFRTDEGTLYALGNRDPFTGANVLSRGILGSRGGEPTVASPMLKHVFSLRTGCNLDDPNITVPTYPVRVSGGSGATGDGATDGDIEVVAKPW